MVGAIGLSFVVPGVMSLAIGDMHIGVYLGVVVGPLLLVFASIGAAFAIPRLWPKFRLPNPFATLAGTALLSACVWAYEAMTETVMFLARAHESVLSSAPMMLVGIAGYLSVRLFLFYSVARYRAEIVSVLLTTLHLTLRLLAAGPESG
jgi:hypothetical protein